MINSISRLFFIGLVCASTLCLLATSLVGQQVFVDDHTATIVEPSDVIEPFYENEIFEVVDSAPQVTDDQRLVVKNPCLRRREVFTVLGRDEVWFISARDFIAGETDVAELKVCQAVDGDLVERSLSDLTTAHQSGDALSTMIYVHGNQTDEEFALFRGFQIYRNALASTSGSRAPVRLVVWAWKSEQEKPRLYPDFKLKAERSILVGDTFAATLNQFSDQNMVVFGYSLGVQVLLSAFDSSHFLPRPNDSTQYQVMFAAPAINARFVACNMLKPGCKVVPIERSIVFTNRKDRAIRVAQSIIRRENPAIETTIVGLSNAGKLNVGSVTEIDIFEEAGRFHSIERYTRSNTLQNVTADFLNRVASMKSNQPLILE